MRVLFAGIAALLLLATPLDEARAQDTPRLTKVSVYAGGEDWSYHSPVGLGASVVVSVSFSSRVVVTGTPQIALQIGSHIRYADFEPEKCAWPYGEDDAYLHPDSGSNGFIRFRYIVQATDLDVDGITLASTSITLNGGAIKSVDGVQDANLSFNDVTINFSDGRGLPSLKVDGSLRQDKVPTLGLIEYCSRPKSGNTYKRGEKIRVEVHSPMTPVTVTGKPQLALQIGTQVRQAVYDPVQSTPHRLIFSYVVQAGDSDNDGFGIRTDLGRHNALTLADLEWQRPSARDVHWSH